MQAHTYQFVPIYKYSPRGPTPRKRDRELEPPNIPNSPSKLPILKNFRNFLNPKLLKPQKLCKLPFKTVEFVEILGLSENGAKSIPEIDPRDSRRGFRKWIDNRKWIAEK